MANSKSGDCIKSLGKNHPDGHAVDDWFLYGPRDSQIAELVNDLVIRQGMRLADVERLILIALQNKKDEFGASI